MEGGSLFNPGFLGANFLWWVGQVADDSTWRENLKESKHKSSSEVPGWGYRYKVRIIGLHDKEEEIIPSDQLPWAQVMYPITAGGGQGSSYQTPAIKQGMFVFGFFLDGQDAKEPAILGYVPAKPDSINPTFASKGSPVHSVKNNTNIIRNFHRASVASDAANSVIWEYGNHIIEMVKNGSIYIEHKSGSYINMSDNGNISVYSANNLYLSANNNVVIQAQKGSISSTANVNFNVIANNSIAMTSGNNATLLANNAVQVTANNAGLTIANTIAVVSNTINTTANTGNFSITNVTFTSNSITLNSSGVITVDASGTLTLDGSTINLG